MKCTQAKFITSEPCLPTKTLKQKLKKHRKKERMVLWEDEESKKMH